MLFITTTQVIKRGNRIKPFLSVETIFSEHWESYLKTHRVRTVEKEEVEKMLSCKKEDRGCFVYYCKTCDKYVIVPFGCNSRLCTCCGKRYTDQWAERLSKRVLKGIIYRHITLSLPEILWAYIKKNRNLQKLIQDTSALTIKEVFSVTLKQDITPGIISILHLFGRDIEFKPHPHCLVTEGGFNQANKFISLGRYVDYKTFHKKWQYNLLTALRDYIPNHIIDYCFRKYPDGFYVYVKPDKIHAGKRLIEYIGRYLRHPAIANSRIIAYNEEAVRFYYEDNEGNKHYKIMLGEEFISAIIQHIPEKNQRLVRYYGIFSRRTIRIFKGYLRQSTINQTTLFKLTKKRVGYCPYCCNEMEFVAYLRKPPPKDLSKITSWYDLS